MVHGRELSSLSLGMTFASCFVFRQEILQAMMLPLVEQEGANRFIYTKLTGSLHDLSKDFYGGGVSFDPTRTVVPSRTLSFCLVYTSLRPSDWVPWCWGRFC